MLKNKGKFYLNLADKELFKDIVFLVEASRTEQHFLWEKYFYTPREGLDLVKSWEDESLGHLVTIGEVDDRPICVQISYAKINSRRVIFYEGSSQLVDHKMIEDWLYHWTKNILWDNDARWAHCDAMNFHLCLGAVKEMEDKK